MKLKKCIGVEKILQDLIQFLVGENEPIYRRTEAVYDDHRYYTDVDESTIKFDKESA